MNRQESLISYLGLEMGNAWEENVYLFKSYFILI